MKLYSSVVIAICAVLSPAALAEDPCRAIVTATVAELRAGYDGWGDEAERLARAAAGAACVKATTGGWTSAQKLSSTAVQVQPAATKANAAEIDGADETGSDKASVADAEQADKSDDSNWSPFSDLKFNKVSASPSKKPYQRRRDSD